jgi:proteasome lid subunit RPN8/RPN11
MTVYLPDGFAEAIRAHAAKSYPHEACGMLTGRQGKDSTRITGVHASDNLTNSDPARSFEVDPKLRFDLMRSCEAAADGTQIVGHYHSHPDHPAAPSETDLAMAHEVDFIWLICGVSKDGASDINAFKPLADRSRFETLDIHIKGSKPR